MNNSPAPNEPFRHIEDLVKPEAPKALRCRTWSGAIARRPRPRASHHARNRSAARPDKRTGATGVLVRHQRVPDPALLAGAHAAPDADA